MTTAEAVARLRGLEHCADPEAAHDEADRILLAMVPPEVRSAYERVQTTAPWWATA